MQIIHVNVYRVAPPSGGGGYYKSHHLQHNIPVATFSSAMKCLRTEGMFLLHARNLGYFFVETELFVTYTPPKYQVCVRRTCCMFGQDRPSGGYSAHME